MTKPIGYYIDTTQLEKLCSRFGQELDLLDRDQEWCDDSLDAYLGKCLDEL